MKITFLIGNGFDLNLGLKTTYNDFYKEHISDLTIKSINENVLYKQISEDIKNWSDFETRLGLFTFPADDENKEKLIDQMKKSSIENRAIAKEVAVSVTAEEIMLALNTFRKDFKKHLVLESEKLKGYNSSIGNVLINGLTEFASDYNDDEKISIYSNISSQLSRENYENGNDYNINFSLLTFNYTNFLEIGRDNISYDLLSKQLSNSLNHGNLRGKNIIPKLEEIYHIHSKLDDGMFLGVDNEKQLHGEIFSENELRKLIKPLSNQKYKGNIIGRSESEIASSNMIILYGTALGNTDSTWWKKIINYLQKSDTHFVLIHKFDIGINIYEDDFFNLEDEKEKIKDDLLFFDKTIPADELELLKQQIFVNLNSANIFNSSDLKRNLDIEKERIETEKSLRGESPRIIS